MIFLDTEKGKFALIQVDKRARNPQILNNVFSCEYMVNGDFATQKQSLHLLTGVFRFICFSDSITENEAEQIVEKQDKRFVCYERGGNEKGFLIARQSFLSLLAEHRLTHNYAILKVICKL